jgi:hypothetical protein
MARLQRERLGAEDIAEGFDLNALAAMARMNHATTGANL